LKFIVDFHIHSHYSRATSPKMCPENLEYWAKLKGIDVVATGDCIHPGYFKELKEKLEPAGNGLYCLKKQYQLKENILSSAWLEKKKVYFILSTEISSIYKKNDKVRKIHNVCVFPDFKAVEHLQSRLDKIGNIRSDGRPILGLDAKKLLEMTLEADGKAFIIPAHIWTPWFSVLGSKSGFDNLEECFEELTPYIFAVETGLSSDPPMNRVCSFLDKFRLVSNSDAHSPEKLGREANLFDTDLSYNGIYDSLKFDKGFLGTIEFFPQEGKYHYDGHRNCNICWNPLETIEHNGMCPKCGKSITKGVMYRVAELADRSIEKVKWDKQKYYSITPLPELIAEIVQKKHTTGKAVVNEYFKALKNIGSEFDILLFSELEKIKQNGSDILEEGIKRLRNGNVYIAEGFDGEYGKIKVFQENEINNLQNAVLFSDLNTPAKSADKKESIEFNIKEFQKLNKKTGN
jgi:DNA helicase II / ATP-dependent DNA helicase PcrA